MEHTYKNQSQNKIIRNKIYIYIGIVIIFAIFLVGCSPIDKPLEKESRVQTVPIVSASEINFGVLVPLTGNAASLGEPVKNAIQLAEEEVNVKNLLAGKHLRLIYEDDSCDPKKSLTATEKLVSVDKVQAIAGSLCSGPVLADAPVVESNRVVLLSFGATNPKIKDAGDFIFRNVPSDSGQGVAGAEFMQKIGAKSVAIIQIQNDWGVGLTDVFSAKAKDLGIIITAIESYDPATVDFKTQIAKVSESHPDAIYMLAFPTDAGILLKQIAESGLKVQIVGADGTKDDAVLLAAGVASEGLVVTLPAVAQSNELETFAKSYKLKYGKEYTTYTPEAYDSVMILVNACRATDCSGTQMKDYLYKMGSYSGASGTYAFDRDGEVSKSYDYFVVKDGKWVAYKGS